MSPPDPPPTPLPACLEGGGQDDATYCTDGGVLCRVRVWSREHWDALPEQDRPARAVYVEGLGWVVALPVGVVN